MHKVHGMTGQQNALKGDVALDSRVFFRCSTVQKGAWVNASMKDNLKLSAWIQSTLDDAVKKD